MSPTYDIILRGGLVVDPVHGRHEVADVALDGAVVAQVGDVVGTGREEIDVAGHLVMPGIVDAHVHLSPWLGGAAGHRMLAEAGVTFALDLAGPIDGVTRFATQSGCGVTIGCIDYVRPGHTVTSTDPDASELRDTLARARQAGAIGLKILGGHFPLSRAASARVIETAAKAGAYVAFHAGTLDTPQGIEGMREAVELAAGNPLHLAHINSYTRGLDRSAIAEAEEAIDILADAPNVWSESYLAPINGNAGKCANGVPESVATQKNLQRGGFEASTDGMRAAILSGWAQVHVLEDGIHVLRGGTEGLAAWEMARSDIGLSFEANPPEPRIHLATARRADGSFAIDGLATDGGGIPRNDLISRGLALVHLDALTLDGFVHKTSASPARALGLEKRKGHLGAGADADVTVVDVARLRPVMSFAHGRPVLRNGKVIGRGARMLVPPEGQAHVTSLGIETLVAEPGSMLPARSA